MSLNIRDFVFEETVRKGKNYYIYKVSLRNASKDDQSYTRRTLLKIQRITDEKALEEEIRIINIRMQLDSEAIRKVYGYSIFSLNEKKYLAVHYEKDEITLEDWVTNYWAPNIFNHRVLWKLAIRSLEALKYIQEKKLYLLKFDPSTILMEMLTHDNGLFKLEFFGELQVPDKIPKIDFGEFSPPETDQGQDIYKSYVFSFGLIMLWCVLKCGSEKDWRPDFYLNTVENQKALRTLCKSTVDYGQTENFPEFLSKMLDYDIKKRLDPKEVWADGHEDKQFLKTVYDESDEAEIQQEKKKAEAENLKKQEISTTKI